MSQVVPQMPVVSPDGTRVAWADGLSWRIWSSAPDGSEARVVAPAPTSEGISDMHWTRQGLLVDSNFTVYLIRPGRRPRVVIPGKYGGFTFAAGGTRVATGLERAPGPYVVTDVVSGRQWRMGSPKAVNNYGALSPDGRRVAWSGPGGVWIARVGGVPHRLAEKAACPTWSPDGKRIAFMRLADLRVISASGGRSRLLHARVGGCQPTQWSPDGAELTFSGPRGVVVIDTGSGALRKLPPGLGETFGGTWSTDGASLYVQSRPKAGAGTSCLDLLQLDSVTLRTDAVLVRGCP